MKTTRAHINPEVLSWARDRAFVDVDVAAKKAGVKVEAYESWETGEAMPTMRQLEKLARAFLVPLGSFFMSERPDLADPIPEMRRLPGANSRPDPELVRQIRIAASRRQLALDLIDDLEEEVPPFPYTSSLDESPSNVAARMRMILGVALETQLGWTDEWEALKTWRTATERLSVLVFQVGLPIELMRGFALSERPLPVIGINSKDSPYGRIFTLIHELTHLWLGHSTLEDSGLSVFSESSEVEQFCNRVAAEVLLPRELIYNDPDVVTLGADATWSMPALTKVSRRFKVSDAVLLKRLDRLGRVASGSYASLMRSISKRRYEPPPREGGSAYNNTIKQVGEPLLRLAFASAYQDRISTHRLSQIVGLNAKYLGTLEKHVHGKNLMFEANA